MIYQFDLTAEDFKSRYDHNQPIAYVFSNEEGTRFGVVDASQGPDGGHGASILNSSLELEMKILLDWNLKAATWARYENSFFFVGFSYLKGGSEGVFKYRFDDDKPNLVATMEPSTRNQAVFGMTMPATSALVYSLYPGHLYLCDISSGVSQWIGNGTYPLAMGDGVFSFVLKNSDGTDSLCRYNLFDRTHSIILNVSEIGAFPAFSRCEDLFLLGFWKEKVKTPPAQMPLYIVRKDGSTQRTSVMLTGGVISCLRRE